jgi:hypothetical protein
MRLSGCDGGTEAARQTRTAMAGAGQAALKAPIPAQMLTHPRTHRKNLSPPGAFASLLRCGRYEYSHVQHFHDRGQWQTHRRL